MLVMGIDMALGPGRTPLPEHLGGVLHGTVEAAVLAHEPDLIEILRPAGDNAPARFTVQAPPADRRPIPPLALVAYEEPRALRFGLTLFGSADAHWRPVLRAVVRQAQDRRVQGRECRVLSGTVWRPGSEPLAVIEEGRWTDAAAEHKPLLPTSPDALASLSPSRRGEAPARLHTLALRSPLLLASRSALREGLRIHGRLPWPSLGSVLDSIAQRMRHLEPGLAASIGLPLDWVASADAWATAPLTPAHDPATQVEWTYRSRPRVRATYGEGSAPAHRNLVLPGILGTLVYPARGDDLEADLMHWGQWLGVGQKTTMGCGQYVWTAG